MIFDGGQVFNSDIHFLQLDEIYIDQGILVLCKKKRTPLSGYDIKTGCQAFYVKKEWDVCLGDSSCYLSWIGNIFGTSLEKKEVVRKGRLNGKLRSPSEAERAVLLAQIMMLKLI